MLCLLVRYLMGEMVLSRHFSALLHIPRGWGQVDSEDRVTELSELKRMKKRVDSCLEQWLAHLLNPRPAEESGVLESHKMRSYGPAQYSDLTHEDLQKLFDEVPVIKGKKSTGLLEGVVHGCCVLSPDENQRADEQLALGIAC